MREYEIESIRPCKRGQRMAHQTNRLIKVTHAESRIAITGHSTKSELEALESAKADIEPLVEIWENSVT